jgi:cytochrome c-type biogenesis protein CcsB
MMDIVLLRVALTLYSIGLAHSIITVLSRKYTLFRVSLVAVVVGFVCHTAAIALRAGELNSVPFTQRYESFSFLAALAALGYLIAYARYRIVSLSVFVFPVVFLLTFIAYIGRHSSTSSVPAAIQSTWIYIHLPLIFLGYAALPISFAGSIMYLMQEHGLKSKHRTGFYHRLPDLAVCDDLAYRSLAIGFPLITLGIVSGALWAQAELRTFWGTDLTVVLSLFTWLIYLMLIYYRLITGWRGKRANYLAIAGFVCVLMSFLGAGYFGGFHSFTP